MFAKSTWRKPKQTAAPQPQRRDLIVVTGNAVGSLIAAALGQGSAASVYEAVHTKSKKKVAIKVIKRNDDINDDESMATELEILRTVRHRYILNCHELYESPQCIWVVMELIKGGELLDVLVERGLYSEADASRAMKQVLLAVRYLHSQGIVHRDLKLQNILLVSKEKDSDTKIGAQFAQFCAI